MLKKLMQTSDDTAALIARLTLGVVILPHGLQKLLGAFGGYGFSGTMDYFTGSVGIPAVFAFLVIMAESFGSLGLILGFLTRFAAFGISLVMLGATFMVHWSVGFFMNWGGNLNGEGFEFHILAIGLAVISMILGGGKWSLDRMLSQRMATPIKVVDETKIEQEVS